MIVRATACGYVCDLLEPSLCDETTKPTSSPAAPGTQLPDGCMYLPSRTALR